MANLTFIEKQLVEDVFGMKSGYVLDFSNRTFDEFMYEVIGESIYSKYEYASKANLLRRFIADYPDTYFGKMIVLAIQYMQSKNLINDQNTHNVKELLTLGQNKLGRNAKPSTKQPSPSKKENNKVDYQSLINDLLKLDAIKNPQARGYAFEKFLNNMFRDFGLDPHASYRTDTDQIDGSFILGGNTILLEAKYRTASLSKDDLILFENKVARKSSFSRGLFVSLSDFDSNVISYFRDRSSRIVAMSVTEIYMICERQYNLSEILNKKFRYLDETGIIYRNIMDLF